MFDFITKLDTKKLIAFLLVGIGLLAILNGVVWYVRSQREIEPGSLPQPTLKPNYGRVRLQYQYSGELPKIDEKVPVYSITEERRFTEEEAVALAQQFEFEEAPRKTEAQLTYYLFTDEQRDFTVYEQPMQVEYGNYQQESEGQNRGNLELGDYGRMAQEFLDDVGVPTSPLSLSEPVIQPITTHGFGEGFEEVGLGQADLVQIYFNLMLDEQPIIPKDRQTYAIEMLMNLDGSVRQAVIGLFPEQIQRIGVTELAQPTEALKALQAGAGVVTRVDLKNVGVQIIDLVELGVSQVNLQSLEIVYVYDTEADTIQPFYRFSGRAEGRGSQEMEIEVLITALPQNLFEGQE